ncbi:hypothetical protein KUCAC02_011578, partial [Chaenocephalus aceratus]
FPRHTERCEALELYCFFRKTPQASVQELRTEDLAPEAAELVAMSESEIPALQ